MIADLEASQEDALADRLAGFTPEERKEYLSLLTADHGKPPALLAELSPVATFWGQKDSFRILSQRALFRRMDRQARLGC